MVIYRGGIIDKTKMYEADSRTSLHDFSIWVLYSCLLLEIVPQNVFCGFLQKRLKITRIVIIAIKASFSAYLISFKGMFLGQGTPLLCFPKNQSKNSELSTNPLHNSSGLVTVHGILVFPQKIASCLYCSTDRWLCLFL
jgi:hypothetical protein